jgi:lactam utilization protein B
VNIATEGVGRAENGELVDVLADSGYSHGDGPSVTKLRQAIDGQLNEHDIELAPPNGIV